MTRDEYFALVEACDAVLRDAAAPGDVMAVPLLHVIREHPVFLAKYDAVFRRPDVVRDLKERGRQRASAVVYRWRARRRSAAGRPAARPASVDVLFVSHLLNPAQAAAPDDFYFGSLPRDLEQLGIRTHTALIDHTAHTAAPSPSVAAGREVLPQVLPGGQEHELARRAAAVSGYLRSSATPDAAHTRLRQVAAWYAQGPEARTVLRISEQVGALTRQLTPRLVITTHEGHAWERMLFRAARRAHAGVCVVGYHATALFALQHALTRSLTPDVSPDVILTAGRVTADALAARPGLAGIPVRCVGSNRRFELAAFDRSAVPPAVVVVPEGYLSECRILFSAAIRAARLQPEIRWFLRLHPQMAFDELRADLQADGGVPSNVVLSTRPLAEDFADASWALYRGSSAAIQAMGAGLRPIYYQADEPLTIDPMSQYAPWRVHVTTPEALLDVIARDQRAPAGSLERERHAAATFAADYFQPLDASVLAALIPRGAR